MNEIWHSIFDRSASIGTIAPALRDIHVRLLALEGQFDELRVLADIEEAALKEPERPHTTSWLQRFLKKGA